MDMKIKSIGDTMIVKTKFREYAYDTNTSILIIASKDVEQMINILEWIDGYIIHFPRTIYRGGKKYTIMKEPQFMRTVNGHRFFKIVDKYFTEIDGITVQTKNFEHYTATSGSITVGTNNFETIKKYSTTIKKLGAAKWLYTVKPLFLRTPSAIVKITYGKIQAKAKLILGRKIKIINLPWVDGIYNLEFSPDDAEHVPENIHKYVKTQIVKIGVKDLVKISTPQYKPGYALYRTHDRSYYVSLNGEKVIAGGRVHTIENGEVDLCSLKK